MNAGLKNFLKVDHKDWTNYVAGSMAVGLFWFSFSIMF